MKSRFHYWALLALTGCGAEPGANVGESAATTTQKVTGPTWTALTNAAPQEWQDGLLTADTSWLFDATDLV